MPNHRVQIPDDLKEFIGLCRKGRLYEVQEWIASGRRYQMPPGSFAMAPLQTAMHSGFHSLVEVLLKAGVPQQEKNRALWKAVSPRRLDMVELLAANGADVGYIGFRELMWKKNPEMTEWFIENGNLELQEGFPMARAFADKHREFLGTFINVRDRVPSARLQASMALRVHTREGDMKWVSLMLWAGADPRMSVPDLKFPEDHHSCGTALRDAVQYSQVEILRKFKLNPEIDNVNELLGLCCVCRDEKIVQMLLEAGGNPNHGSGEANVMKILVGNLVWSLKRDSLRPYPEAAVRCLEIAGSFGGRWRPAEEDSFTYLRRAIAGAGSGSMVRYLQRLIDSGAIEQEVFRKLMDTPQMKKFLFSGVSGSVQLRRLAGYDMERRVRKRDHPPQLK